MLFQVENRILSKRVPTHRFSQILAHFARLFPSLWFVTDLYAGPSLGQDGNLCFLPTGTLSVLWSTLAQVPPLITCSEFYMKKISQTYRLATLGHLANLPTLAENRGMNRICLMVHRSHSQEPRRAVGSQLPPTLLYSVHSFPWSFGQRCLASVNTLSSGLWPRVQCCLSIRHIIFLLALMMRHWCSSTGTGTLSSASFRA